jgi:tetratricopeptide (TPR) repeat protein
VNPGNGTGIGKEPSRHDAVYPDTPCTAAPSDSVFLVRIKIMAHIAFRAPEACLRSGHAMLRAFAVTLSAIMLAITSTAPAQEAEPSLPPAPPADMAEPDVSVPVPQADPAPQGDVGPPAPGVSRIETLIEFEAMMRDGRLPDAIQAGQQLVELTESELGNRHRETARAHYSLAAAQHAAGQHDDAELSYLNAIDIFRDVEGPYGQSLLDPMMGLGDNYHEAHRYANAVSAYNEARTVSRRVHGLLNKGQIEILDKISASLMRLNQLSEAEEQQVTALELVERTHGEDSSEFLDALYRYGEWLRAANLFRKEREQYNRAMSIVRDKWGRHSVQMVRPLRETANSFRAQRFGDPQGASALSRAMDIVRDQPEISALTAAELLLDFADWQTAFSRGDNDPTGTSQYQRAWDLLGELDNGDELREQWFGPLHFVLREPVNPRGQSFEERAEPGFVIVQFDLDERGRPANLVVTRSHPPGLKDDDTIRAIARSRFRPNFVDGEPTPLTELGIRYNFRYLPEDVD